MRRIGYCCAHGTDFRPNWVFSRTVDDANPVSVHLELWDQDDLSADDELDISDPDHPGPSLDISVNLTNCTWEGSGLKGFLNTTASSAGSGDDSAKVYFIVTAPSANCVDSDNDGLLDIWETNGYDADNNGTPDINLAALGANRLRKDLFLELDFLQAAGHTHAPVQAAIQGLYWRSPMRPSRIWTERPVSSCTWTLGRSMASCPPLPSSERASTQ